MKLERRFRNGLNLLASYTFSKTLTDADSTFPTFSAFASNNFGAQNPFNLKTEKTLSYQDTPHALVISYLYELPRKEIPDPRRSQQGAGWLANQWSTPVSKRLTGDHEQLCRVSAVQWRQLQVQPRTRRADLQP